MPDAVLPAALIAECQRFTAYLLGAAAEADVVAAYLRAHQCPGLEPRPRTLGRDRALLRIARLGSGGMRAADAYAALLAKDSLLRRKLVALIAILESRGRSATALDTATDISPLSWMFTVAWHAGGAVVRIAGVACVLPFVRAWDRVSGPRGELT